MMARATHFIRQLFVPVHTFYPQAENAPFASARWARDCALVERLARLEKGNARSWVGFRPWRERFTLFLPWRRV